MIPENTPEIPDLVTEEEADKIDVSELENVPIDDMSEEENLMNAKMMVMSQYSPESRACEDEIFIKHLKGGRVKEFKGFYIDKNLKKAFTWFNNIRRMDKMDFICAICGIEGSAKSTLAIQLAAFSDKTFRGQSAIDRIVYSNEQLLYTIDHVPDESAIVVDEAIISMDSSDGSTNIVKVLKKKFTTIRKKRLMIFLCIPSIFMLQKYFSVVRCRIMIDCGIRPTYNNKGDPHRIQRGYFRLWDQNAKKRLYMYGCADWTIRVRPTLSGTFCDSTGFFIDQDAYERKKDQAILEITEDKKVQFNMTDAQKKIMRDQKKLIYLFNRYMSQAEQNFVAEDFIRQISPFYNYSKPFIMKAISEGGEFAAQDAENKINRKVIPEDRKDEMIRKAIEGI